MMEFLKDLENLSPAIDPLAAKLRVRGRTQLTESGLPTRKLEMWRYTPVERIFSRHWQTAGKVTAEFRNRIRSRLEPEFCHIVFANGVLQPELCSALPGLHLDAHADLLESSLAHRRQLLHKGYGPQELGFESLNLASAESAVKVKIDPDTAPTKPILFSYFTDGDFLIQPLLYVEVGARARATFLEHYHSEAQSFTNGITVVRAQDSSNVTWVRLQEEGARALNLCSTSFFLRAGSAVNSLVVATGGSWSRHFLSVFHEGFEASSQVNGIYMAEGEQQIENYTNIDHVVGRGQSAQDYKGILTGKSRAVFNGRVHIAKDAQLANSAQVNKTLLMSSQAEIDSKPQLEIWADDVKATHGSAIGQLNADELFYLQSRAIAPDLARQMLAQGFVSELIMNLENPLVRDWAGAAVTKKLQTLGLP